MVQGCRDAVSVVLSKDASHDATSDAPVFFFSQKTQHRKRL